MIFRLTGASVRAVCVAILVMLPAFLLPQITQSVAEFTRIVATIMAVFVLYEYGFSSSIVIEFRFAAPYNRIKYFLLLALVLAPTLMISAALNGVALTGPVAMIADQGRGLVDFTLSPVVIVADTISHHDASLRHAVIGALAFNTVIALACALAFCGSIFSNLWRFGGEGFNMWLNMPTYKSYDKNSLNERLSNSAFASVLIACLLPLFGPTIANLAMALFADGEIMTPIVMVWVIAIWSFLPAMFLMRAAALVKVSLQLAGRPDHIAFETPDLA